MELPFAFEAEGRSLLGRGQPDAAIARFIIAGQKAPHFTDPLEGWGEALYYAGRKDDARAQYQKASTLDLTAADKAELARVLMDDDDAGASNVSIVSRTMLVPNYRDLGPTFKSH